MRWAIIIGLLWVGGQTMAQNRPYPYRENWYAGMVVDKNSDTLSGKIQFDWETNSLKIKANQNATVKTFSASNALFFEFYDPVWKYNRQFQSYYYAKRGTYEVPIFFEVIQAGTTSVLMRENDNNSVGPNVKKLSKAAFECYFGFADGSVKKYDGTPRNLFALLPNHQDEVKTFIERKRLDYGLLGDIVRIVMFYNSLDGLN